jgi:hypothetical protein
MFTSKPRNLTWRVKFRFVNGFQKAAASVSVHSPVAPTPFSAGIGWDRGSQWLSSVHHILTGRITLQGRIHPDD